MQLSALINQRNELIQSGQYASAEVLNEQILSLESNNIEALGYRGPLKLFQYNPSINFDMQLGKYIGILEMAYASSDKSNSEKIFEPIMALFIKGIGESLAKLQRFYQTVGVAGYQSRTVLNRFGYEIQPEPIGRSQNANIRILDEYLLNTLVKEVIYAFNTCWRACPTKSVAHAMNVDYGGGFHFKQKGEVKFPLSFQIQLTKGLQDTREQINTKYPEFKTMVSSNTKNRMILTGAKIGILVLLLMIGFCVLIGVPVLFFLFAK